MGLDIYLYTRAQAEANERYEKASEAHYDREDWPSEEAREAAYAALPDYVHYDGVRSERYPDHLFNRRYLRSSYNGGGFNHAVPQMLGTSSESYPQDKWSLNWMFAPVRLDDQYEVELTQASVAALGEVKSRAQETAEALRKADRLRVISVAPNLFSEPPTASDDEALALYRAMVVGGRVQPDGWWSNRDMDVYGDGVKILAAVPGRTTLGVPGVHLIYRQGDEGYDSYIQSAEIVAEFCDEAIELIHKDGSCSMNWSG